MGNRTCLNIKTTEGIYRNLFEGNSSLAHFWLMLLDRADIENVRLAYRHAFSSYDTFQQTDTSITVDQKSALANAAGRLTYIENVYPGQLDFYKEWLGYLQQQSVTEFDIDLAEMAGFYSDTDEFLDEMIEILDEMEAGESTFDELVSETSGWESMGENSFLAYSKAYAQFPEIQELQRTIERNSLSD